MTAHLEAVDGSAHVAGSLLGEAGQADVAQPVAVVLHGCAEHGAHLQPLPLQHHLRQLAPVSCEAYQQDDKQMWDVP